MQLEKEGKTPALVLFLQLPAYSEYEEGGSEERLSTSSRKRGFSPAAHMYAVAELVPSDRLKMRVSSFACGMMGVLLSMCAVIPGNNHPAALQASRTHKRWIGKCESASQRVKRHASTKAWREVFVFEKFEIVRACWDGPERSQVSQLRHYHQTVRDPHAWRAHAIQARWMGRTPIVGRPQSGENELGNQPAIQQARPPRRRQCRH